MFGKSGVWRRRLLGAIGAGVLISSGAIPASAADAVPPAVAQKVAEHGDLWSKLSADPSMKLPVIVQFTQPAVAPAASFATAEDADAALTRAIHAAQDAILGDLFPGSSLSAAQAEASHIKRMDFTPMFGIAANADEVAALAANPNVVSVVEDIPLPPTLNQSLPLIQMPQMFAAGFNGDGYRVAVLDTGVRKTHKFLSGHVVSEACYNTTYGPPYNATSRCPGGATSSTATGSGADCIGPYGCGHGTHVAGTAAGFNTAPASGEPTSGVARGGRIIAINVFSRFTPSVAGYCPPGYSTCVLSFTSDQIKGLERVYALRNTMNIASVNMSLGGGQYFSYCDSDAGANQQKPAIDLLRAARIATVIAAGNDGFNTSVSSPGCISSAVTVASSTKSDDRSSFSNWGNLIDVVAPGSSIYASTVDSDSSFGYKSGTSMATPHVAGAFAALREVNSSATVTQIENALKSTGLPISSAGVTKPRIRVNNARGALGGGGGPTGPANDNFANRITIAGAGTYTGTNVDATREPGEPNHAGVQSLKTVWWRGTPTESETITISTEGSNFDTVLAVYTGSSVSALTHVASNDDINGASNRQSRVSFFGVAGTQYSVAVAGYSNAAGNIRLSVQGGGGGGGSAVIVAATTPVARAAAVGQQVTAFATILNAGSATATSCSVAKPAGSHPFNFSYRTRNHATGALGPVNAPANIPANGRQDYLMIFTPTAPMSTNLRMVFDCTNSNPAGPVLGLNTFLLTATAAAPADVVSTAVTPTLDGVLRVPSGSTGIAALAANNIGASASLQARLSASPIGGSSPALPLGLSMCRTSPSTGACITGNSSTINFTANPNQIITFTAFATHRGTAIPLAPADRRLFIHFYQGSTPVGSASVAVCTIGAANCSAGGSSSQTAELTAE